MELTEIGGIMRVNWKRAWCYHGNSKCGCICNWGDTQTYTCAAVLTSATLLSWYGKPGGCTSRNQTLLTDHTHKTTHIVPGGNNSSIWSLAASGLAFFFSFFFSNRSSEGVYLWPLKDDQAEQDVVRAKQKQSWGISRQLKQTSCKCEGTWYRHSIFFSVDKEAEKKKRQTWENN